MAWNAPTTWNPGETVTADLMNKYVRDNLNVLATSIDTASGKLAGVSLAYFDTLVGMVMVLNSQTPSSSPTNTGTGETVLFTYTLAAGYLANAGAAVRMTAWGTTLNNANAKTLLQYFGANIFSEAILANTAHTWNLKSLISRQSGTVQIACSQLTTGPSNAAGTNYSTNVSNPAQTLSGTVVMKTSATGGATGDITGLGQVIETVIQ